MSHDICQACQGSGVHMGCADDRPPIDMVLHCPACGLQHIDAPEGYWNRQFLYDWENPPHRSHLCHGCGHIWRPADVPTNGVAAVKTKGKADSPIATRLVTERQRYDTLFATHSRVCTELARVRTERDALMAVAREVNATVPARTPGIALDSGEFIPAGEIPHHPV